MAHDARWKRWIKASCAQHFEALRQGKPFYIEGDNRDTATLPSFIEFRIDGPKIYERARNQYTLSVVINVGVQEAMNDTDLYAFDRTMGIVTAAFTRTITVYKRGDGDEVLGCLTMTREGLRVNDFGIIDKTLRKQQGTQEARYTLDVHGTD